MKFDAKMARNIAECCNEIDNNRDLIISNIFNYARNGAFAYLATFDTFGENKYKKIVESQKELEALGFKVKFDEGMKTVIVSW